MSYKTDHFSYTPQNNNNYIEENNTSIAKSFFDQIIQTKCQTEWAAVKKNNPRISDDLFNSYKTDQDFWLKKWSLPTSKQQRALNELSRSQLDCIKEIADNFTIKSHTHFTYQNKLMSISEFESLFTSTVKSCDAPEDKIKKILNTYKLKDPTQNQTNYQSVGYFYLISYLTTNLSARQELFQKIKVMKWKPNTSTCDDFSSHIHDVLVITGYPRGNKIKISTAEYDGKDNFKNAWITKIKEYTNCTLDDPTTAQSNLESLFNEYYVEGEGLARLTSTSRDRFQLTELTDGKDITIVWH